MNSEKVKEIKEALEERTQHKPINCIGCKLVELNVVKEFAERLKKRSYCDNDFMDGKWHRYVFVEEV